MKPDVPISCLLTMKDSAPALIDEIAKWVGIVKDAVTAIAVPVAGYWTWSTFFSRRDGRPKIQFDLELNLAGQILDQVVVELVAWVENKGLVRHSTSEFTFDLFYLAEGVPLKERGGVASGKILFEHALTKIPWIPPNFGYTFVDPGVRQRYTYVTHLPSKATVALLQAHFKYSDKESDFHSAQQAFDLRKNAIAR